LRSVSLHDHHHLLIEERERRERSVSTLVALHKGSVGLNISRFLAERGATTSLELQEIFSTTRNSVLRIMQRLMTCDVVKIPGYVGEPYRPRGSPGSRVPIYGLTGVLPQHVIDAQKRYGEVLLSRKAQGTSQVRIDEAILFIRCVLNERQETEASLKDLIPMLADQGFDLETSKAAAHRISQEAEYKIWQ